MDDTQIFPFSRAPETRRERALSYGAGWPGTFELCYTCAWAGLVGDLTELRPEQVENMLRALEGDGLCMATDGAKRLLSDRPDLREAIETGLDNVLNPDKWLQDKAALEELREDIS